MSGAAAESNLKAIAGQIYSKPPHRPCTYTTLYSLFRFLTNTHFFKGSIELGLDDTDATVGSNTERAQTLFQILMELLLEGIKVKYGEDYSPANLTVAQMEDIGVYVQSYGFVLMVRSDEIRVPPPVRAEPNTELKHFCQRFYDFDRGLWHEAFFDFVKPRDDDAGRLL